MPPKSKSYQGRSKMVPKPKQIWGMKQPTRNWSELPSDLMVNILQRAGVVDVLENAQKVCTAWHEICKDPVMFRVVYIQEFSEDPVEIAACKKMCKYVVHRSSQLRRLEIVQYVDDFFEIWSEAFKKLPLLEELSLVNTKICKEDIEAAGHFCPLLKTLKLNQKSADRLWDGNNDQESMNIQNELALAIGKNLPELTHLELIGNNMTNIGLLAVLNGCCHLESLDLRRCWYVDLNGDFGKRCSQQIKDLKLPDDSLDGLPYNSYVLNDSDSEFVSGDEYDDYMDYDDEVDGYSDYDDYTACDMMFGY